MTPEQRIPTDLKQNPHIEVKDIITDPFALRIRKTFKMLKLPFKGIREDIGAENRIIRNAGIVVGEFRMRYFESDTDLEKRRVKKEYLEKKDKEGNLNEKDKERIDELYLAESRYSKLQRGDLSRQETKSFLEEMQEIIPNSLRIVPEAQKTLCESSGLTIEELICLSVIHKNQKPEVIEKALSFLMHSEGEGSVVLDLLKEYLLRLDKGIYEEVFKDKHVTPLANGNHLDDS